MDAKLFKRLFSEVATANAFARAHGGWHRQSYETIVILDLQKSNFGNYFELNIKIFVQGMFGCHYALGKQLVKRQTGDVFLRPPDRFRPVLDLEARMSRDERAGALTEMFAEFVGPITTDALSRTGLTSVAARSLVYLVPAVRKELSGH